jgi:hypothetical protein
MPEPKDFRGDPSEISDNDGTQRLTNGVSVEVGQLQAKWVNVAANANCTASLIYFIMARLPPRPVSTLADTVVGPDSMGTVTATWKDYEAIQNGQICRLEQFDGTTWTTTDTMVNVIADDS